MDGIGLGQRGDAITARGIVEGREPRRNAKANAMILPGVANAPGFEYGKIAKSRMKIKPEFAGMALLSHSGGLIGLQGFICS